MWSHSVKWLNNRWSESLFIPEPPLWAAGGQFLFGLTTPSARLPEPAARGRDKYGGAIFDFDGCASCVRLSQGTFLDQFLPDHFCQFVG